MAPSLFENLLARGVGLSRINHSAGCVWSAQLTSFLSWYPNRVLQWAWRTARFKGCVQNFLETSLLEDGILKIMLKWLVWLRLWRWYQYWNLP